jgi:hypothetical protein
MSAGPACTGSDLEAQQDAGGEGGGVGEVFRHELLEPARVGPEPGGKTVVAGLHAGPVDADEAGVLQGKEGNQEKTAPHQCDLEGDLEGEAHRQPDDKGKSQVQQMLGGKEGRIGALAPGRPSGREGQGRLRRRAAPGCPPSRPPESSRSGAAHASGSPGPGPPTDGPGGNSPPRRPPGPARSPPGSGAASFAPPPGSRRPIQDPVPLVPPSADVAAAGR